MVHKNTQKSVIMSEFLNKTEEFLAFLTAYQDLERSR